MFAQFRYLDGTNAGEARVVGTDFATLGRDAQSDVRFDPEHDLEVSGRHAAVFKQGGGFLIRDLGSTNGTFLNGERVRGDRPIEPGDRIRLGPTGPEIEFATTTAPPHTIRTAPTPPRSVGLEIHRPKSRPTVPVARPQARPRRRGGWVIATVVLVAAGVSSVAVYRQRQAAEVIAARRVALQGQLDDLRNRIDQARPSSGGLGSALGAARLAVDTLSAQTAEASRDTAVDSALVAVGRLGRRVEPLLSAALTNPETGRRAIGGRVAAIVAEFGKGVTRSATGFVLRAAADTSWLATVREAVVDSSGIPGIRFAAIFDGERVANLARLLRVDDSTGVAVLTLIRAGGLHPVPLDTGTARGTVTQVGFPFGADSLGGWRDNGATSRAVVATVVEADASLARLDGYGAPAWPGSPVISTTGAVVGMVIGAPAGLRVIPVARMLRMVEALPPTSR